LKRIIWRSSFFGIFLKEYGFLGELTVKISHSLIFGLRVYGNGYIRESSDFERKYKLMGDRPLIGITSTIMMTKTIENDSQSIPTLTVYNKYAETVQEAGGIPIVIPLGSPKEAVQYANLCDGIIFTGGEDISAITYSATPHPKARLINKSRDDFEIELMKQAREKEKAVYGTCRGMHLLNVSFGGTIIQDIKSDMEEGINHFQLSATRTEPSHMVSIKEDSLLFEILGEKTAAVNSFHHQAIDKVGSGLKVAATADDGVVEGLEAEDKSGPFLLATQFHPEELRHEDAKMMDIVTAFIEASRQVKNKFPKTSI
jgi:putative glutamine amidotransferase